MECRISQDGELVEIRGSTTVFYSSSRFLVATMAPFFLRNLIPRREQKQQTNLLTVIGDLTWVQWAQFFVGYVIAIHVIVADSDPQMAGMDFNCLWLFLCAS